MIAAGLLFAVLGALAKTASRSIPVLEVTFFRNAMGLLAVLPLLTRLGWRGMATQHGWAHFFRGGFGLLAMFCSFFAIAHLSLADATLLSYTSPLFMPLIAHLWLKEPVPRGVPWLLAVGFAGVALIVKPGPGLFRPAAVVGLLAGVFAAVAQVGIRGLTRTEPTVRIVFYFALFGTLVSAVPAAAVWVPPDGPLWLLLFAMGAVATVAQLFLTRAYRECAPARVGPFIYATVIFAGVLDWAIWRVLPGRLFLVGAALVCLAGVLVIRFAGAPAAPAEAVPEKP